MRKFLFFSFLFIFLTCDQQNQDLKEREIDKIMDQAKKLSDRNNPDRNINKIMSLYKEAEKNAEAIGYKKGIMNSCNALTKIYYPAKEDTKKSIEYSYKTENIAKEINNKKVLAEAYENRGAALLYLGFYKEAHDELQKAIIYYKKNHRHYRLGNIYLTFAGYLENVEAPQDTLLSYLNKSIRELEQVPGNDSDLPYLNAQYYQLSLAHLNMGMFYTGIFKPQQPALAEKHLLKSLKILKDRKLDSQANKLFILNALGRFYDNQHQPLKAVKYTTEVLKLEKKDRQINQKVISYMILANSYEMLKNKDSAIKYMKLYSVLSDSIAAKQRQGVDKTLRKMSSQNDTYYREHTHKIAIIVLTLTSITISSTWLYLKNRNRHAIRNYNKFIKKLSMRFSLKNNGKAEKKIPATLHISEETLISILSKLEKFEQSDKYLKKNVSLNFLTHSLNTNQRYLTEIIKTYRGKSFRNYINGLRIEYITRKLHENPQYKDYKISYLAEECGFTSHQAFIAAFKKETGVTPSCFIENLKKPE